MLVLNESSTSFLKDLFRADGRHINASVARRHFLRAFVEPPENVLEEVIKLATPEPGMRKVVIIDGHPRTGKSWLAYAALCKVIERSGYTRDDWWSSGVDSLKIFATGATTLQEGLRVLQQKLALFSKSHQKRRPRLVFLDDFFGTNTFRPLMQPIDISAMSEMLRWSDDSPLVRLLPDASVTVITGRSFFFLIVETLLGFSLRLTEGQPPTGQRLRLYNRRWGVFTSIKRQIVEGAFDSITLAKVAQNNRKYHPYAPQAVNWLLFAAPLLAFDPETELTESEKPFAARSLFAEDLKTLALQIDFLRSASFCSNRVRSRDHIVKDLEAAYLTAIAPAIAFVGPDASAFEALGVPEVLAHQLRKSMYYSSDQRRFAVVPNEFYTRALRDHLSDPARLGFAADCACRNLEAADALKPRSETANADLRGLLLRGMLESALHQARTSAMTVLSPKRSDSVHGDTAGSVAALRKVASFNELLNSYLMNRDALLAFELEVAEHGDQKATALRSTLVTPGLVSAVGWAIAKFFPESQYRRLHRSVHHWFKENLEIQIRDFPNYGLVALSKGNIGNWYTLATCFSTYLQWAISTPTERERQQRVDSLITLVDSGSNEAAADLLRLILLDELVWALLEHAVHLGPRAIDVLLASFQKLNPVTSCTRRDRSIASALMFSLNWHNAWRDGEEKVYRRATTDANYNLLDPSDWGRLAGSAKGFWARNQHAHGRKDILPTFVNLQYHWLHFTTQRTVWMREWCFQPNPLAFEAERFSQVAAGSADSRNNLALLDLADRVVESENLCAIRNVFLMLSTRRHYLPRSRFKKFRERIQQLCAASSGSDKPLKMALLQAIYELHRQGFLDEPPVVESDFAAESSKMRLNLREIARSEKTFLAWCRQLLDDTSSLQSAWKQYREEVDKVTYITDLHPRDDGYTDLVNLLESKSKVNAEKP